MSWVDKDRGQQCGKEGSEYPRLCESVAHNGMRLEILREVSSHQQQARTGERKEGMAEMNILEKAVLPFDHSHRRFGSSTENWTEAK